MLYNCCITKKNNMEKISKNIYFHLKTYSIYYVAHANRTDDRFSFLPSHVIQVIHSPGLLVLISFGLLFNGDSPSSVSDLLQLKHFNIPEIAPSLQINLSSVPAMSPLSLTLMHHYHDSCLDCYMISIFKEVPLLLT